MSASNDLSRNLMVKVIHDIFPGMERKKFDKTIDKLIRAKEKRREGSSSFIEKGIESTCIEILRGDKSNSMIEIQTSNDELPMEKYMSVIQETLDDENITENDILLVRDALSRDDLDSIGDFIIHLDSRCTIILIIVHILMNTEWGKFRLLGDLHVMNKTIEWVNGCGEIYYQHAYSPYNMIFLKGLENNVLYTLNESKRLTDKQKLFIANKIESDLILKDMYRHLIDNSNRLNVIVSLNYLWLFYTRTTCIANNVENVISSETVESSLHPKSDTSKTFVDTNNDPIFNPEIVRFLTKQIDRIDSTLHQYTTDTSISPTMNHITDRIIEILKSIVPEEGLEYGWKNIQSIESDIKHIMMMTRIALYEKEMYDTHSADYFQKIVSDIGEAARRESESQEVFTQLLSECSNDEKHKKKVVKSKIKPVPSWKPSHNEEGSHDNLKLITTDLLSHDLSLSANISTKFNVSNGHVLHANDKRRYQIAKRVRRWVINDVNKIRLFMDGKKKKYARMAGDEIMKLRMFHHLPGTDLFIDNEAYSFPTKTGKGLIVKIHRWEEEVFKGTVYFGIDKKNIIYHRFFENMKGDANKILSQSHPPVNRSDSNDADWEIEGLYIISSDGEGIVDIRYPDEDYHIEIYPIRPELL